MIGNERMCELVAVVAARGAVNVSIVLRCGSELGQGRPGTAADAAGAAGRRPGVAVGSRHLLHALTPEGAVVLEEATLLLEHFLVW